jgi:hypothetical protein
MFVFVTCWYQYYHWCFAIFVVGFMHFDLYFNAIGGCPINLLLDLCKYAVRILFIPV